MAAWSAALLLAACGGGGEGNRAVEGGAIEDSVIGSSAVGGGASNAGGSGGGGSGGSSGGGGGSGGGGSGGSGGGGSNGGQVAPPQLRSSPQSATVILGHEAVFRVEAGGTGLQFEWQERGGQSAWRRAMGQESARAESSELRVISTAPEPSETYYRALIRNGAGEVASAEARLQAVWGTVEQLELSTIDFSGAGVGAGAGAGDGGSAGGGDGGGVGAGGGLGKTMQVRIAVTRTRDGTSLGSALTGPTSGLVRIKAGRGTAPVLLTLTGTDVGTYFDEGRNALVPYGPDEPPLHSLVTAFDEHLGVTALTEAAYRYAVNQFIADPNAIRDGTAPLRRSATADEIARLTPGQIKKAQHAIRAEINRKLPHRYQLVSIATLPTPVDKSSGRGKIKRNRHGIIQAVTGGLALMGGRFDPSLDRPALTVAGQLADDFTDGAIDGVSLDGSSVFARSSAAYDPVTFAADLTAAADALFDLLGD